MCITAVAYGFWRLSGGKPVSEIASDAGKAAAKTAGTVVSEGVAEAKEAAEDVAQNAAPHMIVGVVKMVYRHSIGLGLKLHDVMINFQDAAKRTSPEEAFDLMMTQHSD